MFLFVGRVVRLISPSVHPSVHLSIRLYTCPSVRQHVHSLRYFMYLCQIYWLIHSLVHSITIHPFIPVSIWKVAKVPHKTERKAIYLTNFPEFLRCFLSDLVTMVWFRFSCNYNVNILSWPMVTHFVVFFLYNNNIINNNNNNNITATATILLLLLLIIIIILKKIYVYFLWK